MRRPKDDRERRTTDPATLGPVPEWGRAAVAAVLDAPWACLPIAEIPGGAGVAERLAGEWLDVWTGLESGPLASLTCWAAAELGYELGERQHLLYDEARHEETVRRYLRTVDDDGSASIDVREAVTSSRVRLTAVEEPYRWYAPGEATPAPRAPKNAGFVPLPFAEMVADEPEPDPDPTRSPAIARLVLLGRIAAPLRARTRSKKQRKKSRGGTPAGSRSS
jgi:hypothetical protein